MSDWATAEAEKLFLKILGRSLHDSHAEIAAALDAAYTRGLDLRPNIDTITALAREIARLGGELRKATEERDQALATVAGLEEDVEAYRTERQWSD